MHNIFTTVGATNTTWVWCPNLSYPGSQDLQSLYPGDDYVDWTGLDGYNFNAPWTSFADLFRSTYQEITTTIAPSKPVMIAEVASTETGGSKAAWISAMFTSLKTEFPKIRALQWFDKIDNGDMDWPKFVITRPPIAVTMRVLALPGDRFAGGFADATQFVCVKIINPNDPGGPPLYGYATRNTLVARATEFALRGAGSEPVPLMMRLKYPSQEESNSPDQLWIQELVAEGWLSRGQ